MNVSIMSREALVDELLAASSCNPVPRRARSCAHEVATPFDAPREQRLARVLGIARELLIRDLHRDLQSTPLMSSPEVLRDWLRIRFAGLEHEVFLVVFLDAQNRVIDTETMFRGTLTQTSVYPREVVKSSLACNAAAVAFAHNHPSGVAEPSAADRLLTQALKAALILVDVRVVDHFIVGGDQLLSMAERGLL
ncbi:MAG: DNA repair protein RadC [Bordetella sp. SCN 67-23]|nr:MAG: DNA repair protein RadC [Bordetella sp. SCN 67-23]